MINRFLHNVKIIKAIILSGNRIAYTILLYKIFALILKPIDILIGLLASFFPSLKVTPKMIFVAGSHRSGATFVSQVIARHLPFYSIGNFNSLFPKSGYLIHKFLKPNLFKYRGRIYQNYYGQTSGLFEINDAHEVWDQWYGGDHSTVPREMTLIKKNMMFSYFSKLQATVKAPIISKSGRNSLNILGLDSIFTDSFFIIVDRDLEDIVISTLKAGNVFDDRDKGWGLKINNTLTKKHINNKVSKAVIQCIELKNKINQQLRAIDKNNYIIINYKEFCNDTGHQLMLIVKAINARFGENYAVKKCSYNKFKAISYPQQELLQKVKQEIKKYRYLIDE